MIEGGIPLRILDYQNVHGVKDVNHWRKKTRRVNKAHEDEFEKELVDCLNKKKTKAKTKIKKGDQKGHQAFVDESQERDEMLVETDHLFSELKTDMDLDEETPNNSDHFSGWA